MGFYVDPSFRGIYFAIKVSIWHRVVINWVWNRSNSKRGTYGGPEVSRNIPCGSIERFMSEDYAKVAFGLRCLGVKTCGPSGVKSMLIFNQDRVSEHTSTCTFEMKSNLWCLGPSEWKLHPQSLFLTLLAFFFVLRRSIQTKECRKILHRSGNTDLPDLKRTSSLHLHCSGASIHHIVKGTFNQIWFNRAGRIIFVLRTLLSASGWIQFTRQCKTRVFNLWMAIHRRIRCFAFDLFACIAKTQSSHI